MMLHCCLCIDSMLSMPQPHACFSLQIKVADFGLSRIKDASQLQNSRAGLEGTIE